MKRSNIFFLLFVAFFLAACSKTINNAPPKVEKGVLDLSHWNIKNQSILKLDGEWEFYWKQLLTPADFHNNARIEIDYINLPGRWNGHIVNNEQLTGKGFASYRVKIKLPTDKENYSLRLKRIETACKVWVNSNLLFEAGKVAAKPDLMIPQWKPATIFLPTGCNEFEIVIQISNFKHKKGGIDHNIEFGLSNEILKKERKEFGFEVFLMGVLLIMAVYHFGLFLLRKKDRSTLYFGLVCLFTIIYSTTSGEIILVQQFPDFPWEWVVKINYLTNYLRLLFFAMFISFLFSSSVSKLFIKSLFIACSAMMLFTVLTPAVTYTETLLVFIVLAVITLLYLLFALFVSILARKDGAFYSLLGTLVVVATAINDILHDFSVIHTFYAVPFGVFVFIFFQSFMLSLRSSRSFTSVEKFTSKLLYLDEIKDELMMNTSYRLNVSLSIILEKMNATKGFIILENNEQWWVEAGGLANIKEARIQKSVLLESIGSKSRHPMLAETVITKIIRTKANFLSNKVTSDSFLANDPYIKSNKVASIFGFALIKANELKAILYLENAEKENAFDEEKQEVLELLSSQISTLIDNAKIYKELEELNQSLEIKVQQRTAEIIQQKEEILAQRDDIESKSIELQKALRELSIINRDITHSIRYAKRIQESILPSMSFIKNLLPESFVFYRPKDILSGDFYWAEQKFSKEYMGGVKTEKVIIAAVDCTGHGVPGALMSIIGNNLLNYAVNEMQQTQPSRILDIIQEEIKLRLRQTPVRGGLHDGMDIAIVTYDKALKRLQFAGAHNPLYLIRNNELRIFKGDNISIGGIYGKHKVSTLFTNHQIELLPNDVVYIFSDGYADQIGGEARRKFMYPAFRNLLLNIHRKRTEKQLEILEYTLNNWQGNNKQIDDILIFGMRFD